MGQYWVIVNLSRHEHLDPVKLGSGAKLVEILAGSRPGKALIILLTEGEDSLSGSVIGRWVGDRIALVGDYAKQGDLAPADNADLLWYLTQGEEGRERAVEHLVLQGELETARRLRAAQPYRDISPDVAAIIDVPILQILQERAFVNPSRREVVIPSDLVAGCRGGKANLVLLGAVLPVLAAAQPQERGLGDLDIERNWHGPERQENLLLYATRPAPMPHGYPALARRTIGRWAGYPITVTRQWSGYRNITADVREVLQHELYWLW